MDKYKPGRVEEKWRKIWEKEGLYRAVDFDKRPKKYILVEFPYPSGERLHVGHARSYSALDVVSRKLRMQGYNVLYPMGWDAFGLPAENYAIQTGINPSITTSQNITNAKKQVKAWGLSFDWSREINTTDPKYYKWTQWIFLKMYEKGLAYQAEVPVNWCPTCKTNLADEEVLADGRHERCGQPTERRMQKQWILRITDYADRLLEDLKLVNYLPKIRIQQENWIGRSEGVKVRFQTSQSGLDITVFTTAVDTIFGTTFIVVSPEIAKSYLEYIDKDKLEIVSEYIKTSLRKSELERQTEEKVKTGVDTGIKAINPFNSREIPIFVADYVLSGYGTGVVMGVPGHDIRDYEFAKAFNLEIIPVIKPKEGVKNNQSVAEDGFWDYPKIKEDPEITILYNSDSFDGLSSKEAKERLEEKLVKRGIGEKAVNYHLHDWVFSRQHYWGEPIPMISCQKCGWVPVPEEQLPVELPYLEKYQPSGTGESPLAKVKEWISTKCPKCGGPARRETDTMPNWAGSNWYFLRYCDPHNDKALADLKKLDYWMPVDLYNGGMEHTNLHLLYSRFIYKFLSDIGVVPGIEPYVRRYSHGVVLGPDGQKMSKSRGNVINPDDVVKVYGADTFRLYEMFMGPFEQMVAWDEEGIVGCNRFLKRVWQLSLEKVQDQPADEQIIRKLHQTIKKVTEDLDGLKFNTAIASMMEFLNDWAKPEVYINKKEAMIFLQILAPFDPYITEELWSRLGGKFSIHQSNWPKYDPKLVKEEWVTVVVQINGKVRDTIEVQSVKCRVQSEVETLSRETEKIKTYLADQKIKKVIFIPGKLINFVI